MMRWIDVGGVLESCVERWWRNGVKGDFVSLVSANSKSGRRIVGMKCICVDEGGINRLLRSKSWQNIAGGPDEVVVDCMAFLSTQRQQY